MGTSRHHRAYAALGGCALFIGGCAGLLVEPNPAGKDDPVVPRPGIVTNPDLCTPVAAAPIRRLSRAEYLATVHDLFPDADAPGFELVSDPADHGFENRAELLNPQPLLIEQYADYAAEVAAQLIEDPSTWMPCDAASAGEDACGRTFIATIGQRIFRRPLTDDEVDRYFAFLSSERDMADFETGVQLTLEAMLQSPQFLYRIELGDPSGPAIADGALALTPHEVATRLSYLVWGSAPDDALLGRASAGELATPDQREEEARRMLEDPRAAAMLVELHREWLDFDAIDDEPKDPMRYPGYDAMASDIREESDRFIARVMWQGEGTFRALLTSRETEVNDTLAELYGTSAPPSGQWAPATLDGTERAGILTRANFLAGRAHRLEGSPPLRGIYVFERFLCRPPPSPPPTADLSEPAASGSGARTNRQLFEERTSPDACRGCHSTFSGLGYAFERYDAVGRYRAVDNGLPVDSSGTFLAGSEDWSFDDGVALSERLADSDEALSCVAGHVVGYAGGRVTTVEDQCRVADLFGAFEASGGDLRELLVAYARQDAFTQRPTYEVGR
ncbi:MAG: DUF1592 domain-containing protein [Sandaracinaceae bacterium]